MKTSLVLLFVLFNSVLAQAQIYQWTDAKGQVHFGDKPPTTAKAKQVNVKINSFENVEVVHDAKLFEKSKKTHKKHKAGGSVVIYSTQRCGYCKKAKRYFAKNGIGFTEYDVEKSTKGASDFRRMQGTGVPIILVGGARMNGFSVTRFEKLYYGK